MKNKYELPELLAPAGDFEALRAAVAAGADAVYIGGKRFGARAYAKNFEIDEIKRAVIFCHIRGVRLYVTVNTLIYEREMADAVAYAKELHLSGVDALIVADIGLCKRLKEEIPDLELHASTQMGIHNTAGADFAYSLGCERVVLARECSADDIEKIVSSSMAECEIFVHGALCVCHSGQCLFSSLVGGRSGNRGECAQPCRLPYNGKYPLSLTDLSLSSHIKRLISLGVSSLKIEGRMKSAEYVYTVTSIYRQLLDEGRAATVAEKAELARVFSRGGFTDGYFTSKKEKSMTGVRSEEDKRATRESEKFTVTDERLPIYARAEFKLGAPAELTFGAHVSERQKMRDFEKAPAQLSVTRQGDLCAAAINAPLEKAGLFARIAKLGNTPFTLGAEDAEIVIDEGINLSPASVNALRRECAEALESLFARPLRELLGEDKGALLPSVSPFDIPRKSYGKLNTAIIFREELYRDLKNSGALSAAGFDIVFLPLEAAKSQGGEKIGAYIPPIIMESELASVAEQLRACHEAGIKYALVGNISHLSLIAEYGFIAIADFRLNISNSSALELYSSLGVSAAVLSPELTLPMARDIGGGVIVAGRIPLMLTERCFIKENFGCDRCSRAEFTDRKGAKFPILKEAGHRNIIFNSTPTYMGDKAGELRSAGVSHCHTILSAETPKEARQLLESYRKGEPLSAPHRRMGKRS